MKLTQAALRSLIKKPGRHSDGGGLYFRVLGEGKAYFVYRFTVAGREREMSLGPFPEISLGEARDKHAELRKQVKVDKIDPLAAKAAPAAQAVPTFGQMADLHIETHEGSWRNPKHRRQWVKTLGEYAAAIRDKPVNEVTTSDVVGVLRPIWSEIPESASRLRGRIEVVLDAARALGHIDPDRANPARWKGHLDHLLPRPGKLTRGHHAALAYSDLPAFWTKLAEIDTVASRALQFVILTCARTSEVLNATWDEIIFPAEVWRVPASRMKMQKPHDVPLSEQAFRLLGDQMGHRGKGSLVFPGGRPKQPLSTMAMSMLLRRMGVDATVHGFRSSARSWMADQGVAFELAEACLAHTTSGLVAAYQRSSLLEPRRPLMQAWANFVCGKADAKVVPIKGRIRAPYRRA